MSNPLRGEATLKAGDVERTIVFDVNAFCELEAATGLGVNELVETMQGSPSFTLLRQIFTAGLQAKHPGTTARDAGQIMSDAGLDQMTEALNKAMSAALPEVKDDASRPPNRQARRARTAGTGSGS